MPDDGSMRPADGIGKPGSGKNNRAPARSARVIALASHSPKRMRRREAFKVFNRAGSRRSPPLKNGGGLVKKVNPREPKSEFLGRVMPWLAGDGLLTADSASPDDRARSLASPAKANTAERGLRELNQVTELERAGRERFLADSLNRNFPTPRRSLVAGSVSCTDTNINCT